MYGHNFCRAAGVAFNLILRNIIRVAVVDKVADFIIFIGKLVVVGVVCKFYVVAFLLFLNIKLLFLMVCQRIYHEPWLLWEVLCGQFTLCE